jgi:hypothetical protein
MPAILSSALAALVAPVSAEASLKIKSKALFICLEIIPSMRSKNEKNPPASRSAALLIDYHSPYGFILTEF